MPTILMLTPDAAVALAKAVVFRPTHALPPALMPME
jgi:hypothetical protein